MLDTQRVVSEASALIDELQDIVSKLVEKDRSITNKIDFTNFQNSSFALELSIAKDSISIKEVLDVVHASIDNRSKIVQEASVKSLAPEILDKIEFSDNVCAAAERELLHKAETLSLQIINNTVKGIQNPGEKIVGATRKVQNAIGKLEDFNKQIGLLNSLIDVFSAIITAATKGVPALIGTLLEKIDTLTAQSQG